MSATRGACATRGASAIGRGAPAASRVNAGPEAVTPASGPGALASATVWASLAEVPDPEVPAVSVVELGIVRDVEVEDGRVRIAVTPTYSGCPATEAISAMIRERVTALGAAGVEIVTRLAPPWTTDWMAPEAKRKLSAFGIAPPHVSTGQAAHRDGAVRIDVRGISPLRRPGVVVPCPRCGSTRTSLLSQFGSTACKAQYRCDECREPFDYFKPH